MVHIDKLWPEQSARQRCAMLRGMAIGRAIDDMAQTFMLHHADLLAGSFQGKDLLSVCTPEVRDSLERAKELARTRVFRHQSKLITEIAAFPCIGSILNLLVPAAFAYITKAHVSTRQSLALELLRDDPLNEQDTLYTAYMKILDFVGGMTDNAAARLAREVSGIGML